MDSNPGASSAQQHDHVSNAPGSDDCKLSAVRQAALNGELADAALAVRSMGTLSDALAKGFLSDRPLDGSVGTLTHAYAVDRVDSVFEIEAPEMLLYDGSSGDAPLVAIVYFVSASDAAAPPSGFTGPFDAWHWHGTGHSACVADTGAMIDSGSATACEAAGGRAVGGSGWMLHVWAVPGVVNTSGVFAVDNPDVSEGPSANSTVNG